MIRTILTLLGVGFVSLALADRMDWTSEPYALAMMTVDGIGATIVLLHPYGRAQKMIGLTFLLQIGVYAGRLLADNVDINAYWERLSLLAALQLALAGGWWLHHEWITWRRHVRSVGQMASSPHLREGPGG